MKNQLRNIFLQNHHIPSTHTQIINRKIIFGCGEEEKIHFIQFFYVGTNNRAASCIDDDACLVFCSRNCAANTVF